MTTTRAFFLLPVVLFAFVLPSFAHAQVSTITTPGPYQDSVYIFYGNDSQIWAISSYANAIVADAKALYNGETPASNPSTGDITGSGIYAGDHDDSHQYVQNAQGTLDRVCTDIDGALGSNPDGHALTYTSRSYSSEGNNTVILWDGAHWYRVGAGGSNNAHLNSVLCYSGALPSPTFSASAYTVNAGQSVTLTWNDTTLRDYNSGAGSPSAGGIGLNGLSTSGVVGAPQGTDPAEPNAVCTASSNNSNLTWSNIGNTTGYWNGTTAKTCDAEGFCYNQTTYAWVSNSSAMAEKKSGSVSVGPINQTTIFKYICTNANGTTEKDATVTVNGSTPKPDLTAGAITPTTATQGTAKTFSSTITNGGAATTGAGSTALFQTANAISGTTAVGAIGDAGTDTGIATLASGASDTASFSYSTTTTGTIYMRACADKSSAGNAGVITESDETNNCGAWTGVIISSSTPLPNYTSIVAPIATPSAPTTNSTVTFTGKVKNSGSAAGGTTSQLAIQIDSGVAGSAWSASTITLTSSATAVPALAAGASSASIAPTSGWVTPSTPGTYKVRVCADDGHSITESDENDNCGPELQITTVSGAAADLTAGAITPTSATQGTAKTFTSVVSNTGDASTGIGFSVLFQTASGVNGSGVAVGTVGDVSPVYSSGILNAAGTKNATLSYSTTTTGTIYMRACADKSSAGNAGVITESDETNNCGAWTGIAVSAGSLLQCNDGIDNDGDGKVDYPTDPGCSSALDTDETDSGAASVSCTSSPASGDTNTTFTYTAVATGFTGIGTTKYTWTDSNGTPSSQGPGLATTFNTTYGSTGNFAAHVHAFRAAVSADADCAPVTVGSMCGNSPSPTISASASRVVAGGTVTLNWSATGVTTSCVVSGPNIAGGTKTSTASSCNVGASSASATVNTQSTYCIVCDGDTASQSCVTVDVAPKIIEF